MKKRIAAISLVLILVFSLIPVAAFTNTAISVTIDGHPVSFDGHPPIIVDGRMLVPTRGVFEHLGFEVSWNSLAQQVTLSDGEQTLILTIGSPSFTVNGVQSRRELDVPARIIICA